MKKFTVFVCLLLGGLPGLAQDLAVTFTAAKATVKIDSVKATNLATDEAVSLPGDATLLLVPKTGVFSITSDPGSSLIFPNPFPGRSSVQVRINEPQDIRLTVRDLAGKSIVQTSVFVPAGENSFLLNLATPGIYFAVIETNQGSSGHKLICIGASGNGNQLHYNGLEPTSLKSSGSSYRLGYSSGDTVRFVCESGDFESVFTDSPMESKSYEIRFKPMACFTVTPEGGTTETLILLDASACGDAETGPADLRVRWDLDGDGSWDTDYDFTKEFYLQYPKVGSYAVNLEVIDQDELTGSVTKTVVIDFPAFTDERDGHIYKYIKIGKQVWMAENLAWLPEVSPPTAQSEEDNRYYVYGYESDSVEEARTLENYTTYGVLYNQSAAGQACPSGWHLPTDDEWKDLEMALGMTPAQANEKYASRGNVAGKLKEAGTAHWMSPNEGATNSTGFTALPGGILFGYYEYDLLGEKACFWTASWSVGRILHHDEVGITAAYWVIQQGFSVRCVRDN
jgi:uncharacterized protein (TIGR02145 family)